VLITRQGQALRIAETDVRVMGRSSRGVCGIKLADADELNAMLRVNPGEQMLLISESGYGKRIDYDNFNPHGRATRGQRIYEPDDKSGEIVCAITVREQDDVVVMTSLGKTLKTKAADVRLCGKTARGVHIVNIDSPDFVVGMDRIINEDEEINAAKTDDAVSGTLSADAAPDSSSVDLDSVPDEGVEAGETEESLLDDGGIDEGEDSPAGE
jgi:DNA gyrase subunit A